MKSLSDRILQGAIRFSHENLGLSPSQISFIGFIVGLAAAGLVAGGFILAGLVTMAVSQILDGLDGGVARQYGLESKQGHRMEIVFDRLSELSMFLALVSVGAVTPMIAILAFVAIVLVTIIEPYSKFDPGFKRFMLYFGFLMTVLFDVRGFQIALNVVFFANLAGFAVGTVMADYRLQAEIDREGALRRQLDLSLGIPAPPDDPPSFLSKLFS